MPEIRILPEHLINQIAAGEVVERPASVVKELIENSVDAGSDRIVIEVFEGGERLIKITDNGCGMDNEDANLALERHATSKISTSEDLFKIKTLGFRGEAIASIASVSKFFMRTKQKGGIEGTRIAAEGGKEKSAGTVGCPEGTEITVEDLFYNTPARKKYLKNSSTEYRHILNIVTGIALSHPHISFKLIRDGNTVFDLPKTDDDKVRIGSLLGKQTVNSLIPVFYGHSQMQIGGYVGNPSIARNNRNNQYLFVNTREVKSHVLSFAVKQSFYSLLPKEKYPVFILKITIDPELVDVNVHPRKQEVRFINEKEIFQAVTSSVAHALEKYVLTPELKIERQQQTLIEEKAAVPVKQPVLQYSVNEAMEFTGRIVRRAPEPDNKTDEPREREGDEEIIPLAQLHNSYIICSQGDSLVLIDQHAAHERIRYTEILEDFTNRKKTSQPLLMPLQIEFSHSEASILKENSELLDDLGFDIEEFGGTTFSVYCVPSYMVAHNIEKVIRGLIDDFADNARKGDFEKRKERSLVYMACRSAVKFGDPLSKEEQINLVRRLQEIDLPYTCPHGRPTMLKMTMDELARKFGRP
jgi:DNA mismatch repair protein MutL